MKHLITDNNSEPHRERATVVRMRFSKRAPQTSISNNTNMTTPLATQFANLPEAQQIQIVQIWIANELFSIANGPSKTRQAQLNLLKQHPLFTALPEEARAKTEKMCQRCEDM